MYGYNIYIYIYIGYSSNSELLYPSFQATSATEFASYPILRRSEPYCEYPAFVETDTDYMARYGGISGTIPGDAVEVVLPDHDSNALMKTDATSQYYCPPAVIHPFHASNVGDARKTEYTNIYIYIYIYMLIIIITNYNSIDYCVVLP